MLVVIELKIPKPWWKTMLSACGRSDKKRRGTVLSADTWMI
jgi:hypothetical protein